MDGRHEVKETNVVAVPEIDTWRALWSDVPGGWLAADGFWGVPHPDGRYLFLCGDTAHRRDRERGTDVWWSRTSAVIWDGERLETCSDDALIPGTESAPGVEATWHWGGPMVWDGPDLWCMSLRCERVEGGFGFRSLPRALVQLSWPSWGKPSFVREWPLPVGRIDWGALVVRTVDWVYVYGVTIGPGEYGHQVYVARVRDGRLPFLKEWAYFAAGKWVSDPDSATPILSEHGPSGTFSVHWSPGGFRLTSKSDGDFGTDVCVWRSKTAQGPWLRKVVGQEPWSWERMSYGATAHPLLMLPSGKHLISVPHNGNAVPYFEEPDRYRPAWLETDA
jgi:Domain of unknown function (DUF4185)